MAERREPLKSIIAEPLMEFQPQLEQREEGKFDIQEVILSSQFIQEVREIKDASKRRIAIGWSMEYSILQPDGFNFWIFLQRAKEYLQTTDQHDHTKQLAYLLGLSMLEEKERNRAAKYFYRSSVDLYDEDISKKWVKKLALELVEEYADRCVTNGKAFHGFNGSFEDSIRKHGLSHTERAWQWEDISEIEQIIQQVTGREHAAGWAKLNSENNVYVDYCAEHVYWHGVSSPEWFGLLLCEITKSTNPQESLFGRKNYNAAKAALVAWLDEKSSSNGFTEQELRWGRKPLVTEERIKVLTFFEKYWPIFAGPNSGPRAALIDRSAVKKQGYNVGFFENNLEQYLEPSQPNEKITIRKVMEHLLYSQSIKDIACDEIPPKAIKILQLPVYDDIYPPE